MARRGKRKEKEELIGVPEDLKTHNSWLLLSSVQWVLKFLYNRIETTCIIRSLDPDNVNTDDIKELFKALEPLQAWSNEEERRKRLRYRKDKK